MENRVICSGRRRTVEEALSANLTRKVRHGWAATEVFPGLDLSIVSGMVKYSDMWRFDLIRNRSSGVNFGLLLESRGSGYSRAEPQRSGIDGEMRDPFMRIYGGFYGVNRRLFSLREIDFKGMDKPRFHRFEA